MSERILGLDHVQLTAPPGEEEPARRFYGDLLGLPEVVKPAALRDRGGAWFSLGGQQLHVGVQEPFVPARKAHPALRVGSAAALDAFAQRLESAGAPVEWDAAIADLRRFFTRDPWGNRLELLADASARRADAAVRAMRIFLAGASGVIGSRLLARLLAEGHAVAGMTRTPAKADALRGRGAVPVVCDVYDGDALGAAVRAFAPDLVIHQLTDLPDDSADLPARRGANARIRREGTRNLLAAAGTTRVIAQSVAWKIPRDGAVAVREHEHAVLDRGGVVIRYGQLYGPGTYYETDRPPHPRVHVDAAARRSMPALDAGPGVLVVAEAADQDRGLT